MVKQGMNKDDIKSKNRGLVLKLIASSANLSRADITRSIGLTKMSVSNIVNELIADGWVIETAPTENCQVGRNPISLGISPNAPKLAGIYISRDSMQVILCDLSCQTIAKSEVPFCMETSQSLTDKLISLVSSILDKTSSPILGIGVSAIGPLDCNQGVILKPTNFYGIENYPIVSILKEHFSLPVTLNNDMNAAALVEQLFGYGSEFQHFAYVGISNGIGSGIISDGRLFQNSSGFTGEIGHMGIDPQGELCTCGRRGCLELYASMPVILSKLKDIIGNPNLSCTDFEDICHFTDCDAIFIEMMEVLSYALTNVVNMLDPECIIIGHEGFYLPSKYLTLLEEKINYYRLSAGHKQVKVLITGFGMDAPLIGSVSFLLEKLFSGRINFEA